SSRNWRPTRYATPLLVAVSSSSTSASSRDTYASNCAMAARSATRRHCHPPRPRSLRSRGRPSTRRTTNAIVLLKARSTAVAWPSSGRPATTGATTATPITRSGGPNSPGPSLMTAHQMPDHDHSNAHDHDNVHDYAGAHAYDGAHEHVYYLLVRASITSDYIT